MATEIQDGEAVVNIEYYINQPSNSTEFNNFLQNMGGSMHDNINDVTPSSIIEQDTSPYPSPFLSNEGISYSGIINTNDLFNNKINLFETSGIKEIKEKVLEILLKKSDFEDEEYNELNYENKEIDIISEKIDGLNKDFKIIQSDIEKADMELKEEIKLLNDNLKKLDYFIDFIQKLGENIDAEDKKDLINQIKKISQKISNPDSFIMAKKEYIKQRKKLLKYIYFFRKVNKWNIANICSICWENPVDHFIDPCGHTFCKSCIKEQFKVNEINEIKMYSHRNNLKCPACRQGPVNKANPLYFL